MKHRAEQWVDWHSSYYYKEVYWLDTQESECGRAWEETMFGGQIAPINNRVDGSHGIGISDWPPRGTQNDPERKVWSTISMRYIERLFQMNTWRGSYSLKNWRIFNVPRDGATSLYINSFTTMSANEEQRVAKQDLAEAIALANAQPAQKKRVKATGRMEGKRPKDEKLIEEAVTDWEQQPESPKREVPALDGKRRISSPGAIPGHRLILSPRTRQLSSVKVPEDTPLQPMVPQNPTQMSPIPKHLETADKTTDIYPEHGESLTTETPKTPTSEIIKKLKTRQTGLMDVFRQRKKTRLANKAAEAKRMRDAVDNKMTALQESLIREAELMEQLAAARSELRAFKEAAEAERLRVLAGEVEAEVEGKGK